MSQKMSLNQVLAPQLQQSLNLLQAPMLELKAMVDQELQLNPVLEEQAAVDAEAREKGEPVEGDEAKVDLAEPPSDTQYDSPDESNAGEPVDDFQKEITQLLELDQDWRAHFSSTRPTLLCRSGLVRASVSSPRLILPASPTTIFRHS